MLENIANLKRPPWLRALLSTLGARPEAGRVNSPSDWLYAAEKARVHKVSTLVAKAIREGRAGVPQKTADEILKDAATAARVAFVREAAFERLKKRLGAEGLRFAVAKGPEIRRIAYPKDAAREYADFDLAIDPEDYGRFFAFLRREGFSQKTGVERGEEAGDPLAVHYPAFEGAIALELHPFDSANARGPAMLFKNALARSGGEPAMNPALEQLLYVCEHNLLSHRGFVPLRSHADAALLFKVAPSREISEFAAKGRDEYFKILLRAQTALLERLGLLRSDDIPEELSAYKVKSFVPSFKFELITRSYGSGSQIASQALFGPYGANTSLLTRPAALYKNILREYEGAPRGALGLVIAAKRALFYGGPLKLDSLGIQPPK